LLLATILQSFSFYHLIMFFIDLIIFFFKDTDLYKWVVLHMHSELWTLILE
jgi:hypothetical protein